MSKLVTLLDKEILSLFEEKGVDLSNIDINEDNPEIDVEELAKLIGCKVDYQFLFSKAGSHENGKIVVNELDPIYRQRFTLAHEIGHNLLEHDGLNFRTTLDQEGTNYISSLKERQANAFAAKLLMPKKLVEKVERNLIEQGQIASEVQKVRKLAEKFNVSYISMDYRLQAISRNKG